MCPEKFSNRQVAYMPAKIAKRERSFELPLPILISGVDAKENEFQERTKLSSISSQHAVFGLNSGVKIGSNLTLCLDIPKTIILEKQFKLVLTGTVTYIKAKTNFKKKQLISVRLDKKYKIRGLSLKIN